MKSSCFIFLLLLVTALASNAQAQTRGCATMDRLQTMQQQDPGLVTQMQAAEAAAQQWIAAHGSTARGGGPITIPVVFHVVYKLPSQMPHPSRLHDQLRVLNEDYGATNPEFPTIPAAWASVAANTNIQFCLARQDPQGDTTSGITYTQTTVNSFSTNDAVKYTNQRGHDAWDATRYLNIWICNLGNGLLSYAQFPGGPAATDGVVLSYTVAGPTGNQNAPYNLGRSATHDVGHWLGLSHLGGNDPGDCSGTDNCADTPNQAETVSGCFTFPHMDSCTIDSPGIMFMNFLNLCDDSCSYMFTNDQASRMLGFLTTARSGLVTSTGCDSVVVGVEAPSRLSVTVFPNPSHGRFEVGFKATGAADLAVYDVLGRPVARRGLLADGDVNVEMELPVGIYFVRVLVDGVGVSRRVLVE